MNLNILK